jgi:hypothetical protein
VTEPQIRRLAPIVAGIALGTMFAVRLSGCTVDPDLYHEMALARATLELGAVPTTDLFAFTPVHPVVVHHEWGAGVVALTVASLFGGAGILALKYVLAAALAFVAVRTMLRAGGDLASVAIVAPIAILFAEIGFSPVRAHAYSFLLCALTLACIERDREGDRRWLPFHAALFVLWVNLHGGWVLGLLLLGAYTIEAWSARGRAVHVVALIAVEVLLVVVNPWGPKYYGYIVRALTMTRHRIHEWDPLWTPTAPLLQRLAFLTSVALVLYALSRGHARKGVAILAVTAFAAVRAWRFLPFYAIAWLVYCPALLRGTPLVEMLASQVRRFPRVAIVATCAATLGFVANGVRARPWVFAVPNAPRDFGVSRVAYPVGAVRFLRASGFRGNLMTSFETGAYVSWKLYPDVKVSLDGRYELAYPDAVFDDVLGFYEGWREPEEVVAKYGPDAVLLPPGAAPLRDRLRWPSVYDDGSFAVLARPGLVLTPVPEALSTTDEFP